MSLDPKPSQPEALPPADDSLEQPDLRRIVQTITTTDAPTAQPEALPPADDPRVRMVRDLLNSGEPIWLARRIVAALFRPQPPTDVDALDALRQDAERYRWLRTELDRIDPAMSAVCKVNFDRASSDWANFANAASLDAAIDAARAAREKP